MLASVVRTTEQPLYGERPSVKQNSAPGKEKKKKILVYNENIEDVKDEENTHYYCNAGSRWHLTKRSCSMFKTYN